MLQEQKGLTNHFSSLKLKLKVYLLNRSQDSYGVPQGSPLPSASSAPDSYGIPQGSPVAPQPAQSASAPNSYGIPQVSSKRIEILFIEYV